MERPHKSVQEFMFYHVEHSTVTFSTLNINEEMYSRTRGGEEVGEAVILTARHTSSSPLAPHTFFANLPHLGFLHSSQKSHSQPTISMSGVFKNLAGGDVGKRWERL